MVLECQKLYFQDMDAANFLDETIINNYSGDDLHRMYVSEITRVLIAE